MDDAVRGASLMPSGAGLLSRVRGLAVDVSPLRESVPFRWLWLGDVFQTFGRQIPTVAIAVQVYGLTGSSFMVGLVSLAQLIPLVVGSLVGGVVIDAVDRRRVILTTQAILMVIASGLALNAALDRPVLWPIFVLGALQAAASGFDAPSRRAALPSVVRLDQLSAALTLQQILSNLGKLLVPAVTGVLIAAFGLGPAYWLYAVVIAGALLSGLPLPSLLPEGGGRRAGWSSLVEGLAYIGRAPLVRALFLTDMSAMVFGLPRALFPAIGTEVLGGDAATVGLLYSAPGIGALIGALTSGWVGRVQRIGRAIVLSLSFYGLAMIGVGLSRSLVLTLTCLAVSGAADFVSAVLRNTLLQATTPDALRGRVTSVNKVATSGGPLVGDTRAGLLATTLGSAGVSVVTGGVLCLVSLGVVAWRYRVLRSAVFADGAVSHVGDAPPTPAVAERPA